MRNLWRKRYGVECLYCNETEGPFHTRTEAAHAARLLETVHCHRPRKVNNSTMSQEEATHWREKLNMLPDRVQRALMEQAPSLPPPPDPANIHAIMWTVIAVEAALEEEE